MDENGNKVTWAHIFLKIFDGDLLELIRMIFFMAILFGLPIILYGAVKTGFDFFNGKIPISPGALGSKCFEIKEVAGRTFKLNTCTGDYEEIPVISE